MATKTQTIAPSIRTAVLVIALFILVVWLVYLAY
jgi:hypothetical protein